MEKSKIKTVIKEKWNKLLAIPLVAIFFIGFAILFWDHILPKPMVNAINKLRRKKT